LQQVGVVAEIIGRHLRQREMLPQLELPPGQKYFMVKALPGEVLLGGVSFLLEFLGMRVRRPFQPQALSSRLDVQPQPDQAIDRPEERKQCKEEPDGDGHVAQDIPDFDEECHAHRQHNQARGERHPKEQLR